MNTQSGVKGSASSDAEPFIGYIRVSTWKEEKISPELQQTAIEEWARRTGRRIVGWVSDLDATGRNFKRKIMQCVDAVERGNAVGIAVWKFSRFGRDRTGIAINLARVERVGGRLESATESVDASTAVGKFNRGILFEVAAFESDRAGEQWEETHAHRRSLGLPATGRPRLGYIWHPRRIPDGEGGWTLQDERYEIDPKAGDVVATLYDRKIAGGAGGGYSALAAWLNALGYRTSRGSHWRADSLRRYMDAGFPAGKLRIHDPVCNCDYTANGGRCTRWVHVDGAHNAIITPETWEQYQEVRARTKATAPRARNASYPLTGLLRCGECRGDVTATSARRRGKQIRGWAYWCGNRMHSGTTICTGGVWVQRTTVEAAVFEWLRSEVAPGVDAAPSAPVERPSVGDERARAARERAHLQGELAKIEAALDRLVTDYALDPDKYPADSYVRVRDQLTAKKASLTADMSKLAEVEQAPDRTDYTPIAVGLVEEWDTLLTVEKNALLRQLVRRVVCTRDGRGSHRTRIDVHPVWEPDPWAT